MVNSKRRATKHDIEDNWNKAINFKPLKDEVIVYDEGVTHKNPYDKNSEVIAEYDYKRFKIGDGVTNVIDLPFTYEAISEEFINNLFK